jgi:hypothetical protein
MSRHDLRAVRFGLADDFAEPLLRFLELPVHPVIVAASV